MGCDVHSYVETFDGERWSWNRDVVFDASACRPWEPFDRSYALFGFLAGVRDRDVPQIHPTRGLPADCCEQVRHALGPTPEELRERFQGERAAHERNGLFGHSWATGAELVGFDFTIRFPCPYMHGDERPSWSREPCGHESDDPEMTSVGEYLGGWVDRFGEIARLCPDPHAVRVVYAFDN